MNEAIAGPSLTVKVTEPNEGNKSILPLCSPNSTDLQAMALTSSTDARHQMFNTIEPAPDTLLYRDFADVRPSVQQLIIGRGAGVKDVHDLNRRLDEEHGSSKTKRTFGMIEGVFCRCLLNIFGVLMFLRLGWIVGHSGIGLTLVIIIFCMLVTSITTSSLSAICTNGEVRSGGAYFMISRSLGPNFGGAIGILFSLANAGAVALHLIGFAEQVVALTDSWHIRLVGSITLVFLICLALVGVGWVIRVQLFLLALLVASILSYFLGTFQEPDSSLAFTGYSTETFKTNWWPDFRDPDISFITQFAVFFPASTGIMAGANISGDLRNPQKAIPVGTFSAVAVSGIIYIALAFILGATLERESFDTVTGEVTGGLFTNFQIMVEVSAVSQLIVTGIFAAGLSSALAALVGAPRVLQAVAADNLFPIISPLQAGSGANNEPVYAYCVTFIVAIGFIMMGDLNTIAPLITNFFMISYALINYACFAATDSRTPGWRPSFRFFNKWVALLGVVVCIVLMFVIDVVFSLVTLCCTVMLYKYVEHHPPNVNWGSARAAQLYRKCARSALELERTKVHVKTFRPAFLLLTAQPDDSLELARFFSLLANEASSVLHVGRVICAKRNKARSGDHEKHNSTQNTNSGSYRALSRLNSIDLSAVMAHSAAVSVQVTLNSERSESNQNKSPNSNNTLNVIDANPNTAVSLVDEPQNGTSVNTSGESDDARVLSNTDIISPMSRSSINFDDGKVVPLQRKVSLDAEDAENDDAIAKLERGEFVGRYNEARDETTLIDAKIEGFIDPVIAYSLYSGYKMLMETSGVGRLRPNTVVLEFPTNWRELSDERVRGWINVVRHAFALRQGVVITIGKMPLSPIDTSRSNNYKTYITNRKHLTAPQESLSNIDVWWLSDDGGLTVLLPYLLSKATGWSRKSTLRVISGGQSDLKGVKLLRLLERFRIAAQALIVDISPRNEGSDTNVWEAFQLDPERHSMCERTRKCIRLCHLLKEHSSMSKLVVMSLPVPSTQVSERKYMAWLELCAGANLGVPVMLVRGTNQVLTYYS